MLRLPKSSAEILAAAKRAYRQPIRPRTPVTDDIFNSHLSEFSVNPTLSNESTTPGSPIQLVPTNVHQISNLRFFDTVTPQTLEAAIEIKETPRKEHDEDLMEDDLDTWVLFFTLYVVQYISYTSLLLEASISEPESPVDSISSSKTRLSPSERIQDVLALLRDHRLSPFDLVQEILNESQPQYSCYRTEFYKEGNEKLFRFLDTVISVDSGKSKLKAWMQKPAAMDIFCDVITEEMNGIQLAEQLPKIAAVTTPEFIRDWTVSSHQEIAPCIQRILLAAAQTSVAKEKNKKKVPDIVRCPRLEKSSF